MVRQDRLVDNFREEMPRRGRYVFEPAVADERGVVSVPPPAPDAFPKIALGVGVAAVVAMLIARSSRED